MSKKRKILIIGIDGLSPRLVERWMPQLPNFQRLKEEGVLGTSIPPCPAQTPVAWTTFMTGKNPGKHGIFSFAARKFRTYEREIARPNNIQAKTLFQLISEQGKKVGAVNVPMSSFQGVNGFMIPGFLDELEGIPQPSNIRKTIQDKFGISKLAGDVETDLLSRVEDEPDQFFSRVEQLTEIQLDICLHLLECETWDLFMTVFMGGDRIQHFFWKNIDPTHPHYKSNTYSRKFKEFYLTLDDVVGKLLEYHQDDMITFLVSDHSFCPVAKEMILNNYLQVIHMVQSSQGRINVEKSKAISYGYGDIWINVNGREPNGVVTPGDEYNRVREAIITHLKNISIEGHHPIAEVKRREELYWGPYSEKSPDLVTIFTAGWQAARRPELINSTEPSHFINEHLRWSGGHDGTHDPTDVPGILGILGSNLKSNQQLRVYLRDLAPTILKTMDLRIPQDMDGQNILSPLSS
jgi:predicted AlkP superfamily phosphohydrolase/phosphomutase